MKLPKPIDSLFHVFRQGWVWIPTFAVLLVVSAVVISFVSWDWPEKFWGWLTNDESGSTTIRNLGLVLAGLIALPLAIWRSIVADRQASAAQRQATTAQKQADTAQQSLLNERYQRGAEMLGNEVLSVRIGGIYALKHLASEDPEQYHIQIMELLCTFVRHPTRDDDFLEQAEDAEKFLLREDVQAAMRVIGRRGDRHRSLAGKEGYHIDLHGADLRGGSLRGLNLSSPNVDMVKSMSFHQASSNPALRTDLSGARLHGADLFLTDISGIDFSRDGKSPATGLTASQIIGAHWDDVNPPTVKGLVDIVTGKPLRLSPEDE